MGANSGATTAAAASPSTRPAPAVQPPPKLVVPGDTVLVLLDPGRLRPMIVSWVGQVNVGSPMSTAPQLEERINGTIFCEPDDHNTPALRLLGTTGHDPARIHGRPERYHTTCYGEALKKGSGVGEWRFR